MPLGPDSTHSLTAVSPIQVTSGYISIVRLLGGGGVNVMALLITSGH